MWIVKHTDWHVHSSRPVQQYFERLLDDVFRVPFPGLMFGAINLSFLRRAWFRQNWGMEQWIFLFFPKIVTSEAFYDSASPSRSEALQRVS